MVKMGLKQLDHWMQFDAWCKAHQRDTDNDPED